MLSAYSYSSLDSYRNCPRKFSFRYIERVPTVKTVTADTYLGNAVHRVLQKMYTLGADGILFPKEDMLKLYHGEWAKIDHKLFKVISEFYTIDDYIRIGEEMLIRHHERHAPFDQGTLLGAEMHISFHLLGTPFKFRCYIDRLWRRDDGVVEICDYKTGQNLAQPSDPRFRYQMGLYQLAVQSQYPQYEQIDLAQYFLRKDEIVRTRLEPGELEQLAEEYRLAVAETIEATRLESFPAKEGPLCNYCDFQEICPAKRHRAMLDGETDVGEPENLSPEGLKRLAEAYIAAHYEAAVSKKKLDGLKADLLDAARQTGLSRLDGETGYVGVKLGRERKFVTKTEDAAKFAELTSEARQMGLDDYFNLDGRAVMKDLFSKGRLPEDQAKRLEPFVVEKETSRVSVKLTIEENEKEK
ncbi:MAG: PD-(D/E)XK nuclease family protein [candidate division Zixibacteria bacterium]|nr:PD-(D/E)XK nuclease family protein [candidate division Zixibacteria bacterium]